MRKYYKSVAIVGALLALNAVSAHAQTDTMMKKDHMSDTVMMDKTAHPDAMMKQGAMKKETMMKDKMAAPAMTVSQGQFSKKTYKVKGDWTISKQDGQTILTLSESFKTNAGPDLKLFLSPMAASKVTGKTATQGSLKIGALKSNKGAQSYVIPAGVDLSSFQSVLVHCEAYSKLWAAGAL